jgi:PTH2 family peptidyl-tRNA hydrolase
MVLVVRKDLKMSAGLCAEQCASAAVAVIDSTTAEPTKNRNFRGWLQSWNDEGVKKITLSCPDAAGLTTLAAEAEKNGLPFHMSTTLSEHTTPSSKVNQPARTIAKGELAVLAIGPGPDDLINKVSGHLTLIS